MSQLYPLITKEQLPDMIFIKSEVLLSAGKIKERGEKLIRAARNSKFFSQKATIVFETRDGLKTVHAGIWETTDNHIVFMGGISIPVCCIHDVDFERN